MPTPDDPRAALAQLVVRLRAGPEAGRVSAVDELLPLLADERVELAVRMAAAARAVESLPDEIKAHLENVVIDVEDEPTPEFLREAGFTDEEIDAGESLYGYFLPLEGVASAEMLENPNRIIIFRNPILRICETEEDVVEEVRTTVVHEIAHHFGIDDERLHELGWG